jgi:predicted Ser/Thr protein kinase
MATKQTSSELYDERRQDITRVMDWIELELDKHKTNAKADPKDWSYAGDLGHVREKLIATLAFLSNSEPEDIENLLGECR